MLEKKRSLPLKILRSSLFILFVLPAVMLFTFRYPPKIESTKTPADFGIAFSEVRFTTQDGIELAGWFIPRDNVSVEEIASQPTIILLHGWPADKGNILPLFTEMVGDYNLFLFDFRGLGESEDTLSTVGVRERKDLVAALDFLEEEYRITEVGVWGFSVGGAVALMTAPSDKRIKAVFSDSAYASLSDMSYELYRVPYLKYPLGEITALYLRLIWKVNIKDAAPEERVSEIEVPLFLTHSKDDEVIPFSHGERLMEKVEGRENVTTWISPGKHGFIDPAYIKRVDDFFKNYLYENSF